MAKNKQAQKAGLGFLKPILISIVTGLAVCFFFMLLFAFILSSGSMSTDLSLIFSMAASGFGALTAGLLCAKLFAQKGMLYGAAAGLAMYLVISLVGAAVTGTGFTAVSGIRLAIILLCAAIGGVMGVNIRKKQKF